MSYSALVEAFFFNPKHVGILDPLHKNARHIRIGSQALGEFYDLYAEWGPDRQVVMACFKASGTPFLLAGLEWLCSQLQGSSITSLTPFSSDKIATTLDIPKRFYPSALLLEKGYNEMITLLKRVEYD